MGPYTIGIRQKKFVIVAVDYFTKWQEAEVVATITQRSVEKFLWENIMYRFGVSYVLISENGPQLKGDNIQRFCDNLHIKSSPSAVAHPQKNGFTEATNKNTKTAMKKKLK